LFYWLVGGSLIVQTCVTGKLNEYPKSFARPLLLSRGIEILSFVQQLQIFRTHDNKHLQLYRLYLTYFRWSITQSVKRPGIRPQKRVHQGNTPGIR